MAIEVGDFDAIHVDDVEVSETGEGQVFEELASQAAGSDYQDSGVGLEVVPELGARFEPRADQVAGPKKELVEVPRPAWLRCCAVCHCTTHTLTSLLLQLSLLREPALFLRSSPFSLFLILFIFIFILFQREIIKQYYPSSYPK